MVRITRKRMIERRLAKFRKEVEVETQIMREKALKRLEELFNLAASLAKGKVKTQTENGKKLVVTLPQRQKWAHVAAYIAQVMNSIATRFDERQIDVDLDELERLINEAKAKAKGKKTKRKVEGARKEKVSKGTS